MGRSSGLSGCSSCQAGRRAASPASTNCSLCEPGFYADADNSASCVPCPPVRACRLRRRVAGSRQWLTVDVMRLTRAQGRIANASGLTDCALCAAGQFGVNQRYCAPCAAGRYSGSTGSSTCIACAAVGRVAPALAVYCKALGHVFRCEGGYNLHKLSGGERLTLA